MKAIEYLEEQKFGYDHFTELTSTGINPDNDNIAQFAEDYHQAKLNLLTIPVVVGSLPTDEQIDDKVDRVTASTWGDYGAGYIDGTRNGAQWVVDVVNGEDK
jgi:hypothetical protein